MTLGLRQFSVAVAAIAGLTSCSSVQIIKVTDAQPQPEGIPFYLPRPYVQVFEPFVIGSKAYLVSGKLSPDGKYLLIDNVLDDTKLDGLLKSDLSKENPATIPVALIRPAGTAPASPAPGGGPQGGDPGTPSPPSSPASAASAPGGAASAPAPSASAPGGAASAPADAKPVGQFNLSVTNTTALFPPTLGRRFFDVVWMPDFDEKYVIQGKPGLGNANIGVTMTQGWGLYGLDAQLDNSALVKPLLDFYTTGLDALGKLARSKIFPAGDLAGGGPQGQIEKADIPPGARVTVKVTRVQVVAPGLYPILKPKEESSITEKTSHKRDLVVRHIPQRPYTNIAFNTYEVLVIEAAKPSGDTPMNLQRYFDQTGPDGGLVVPPAAPNKLTDANKTPLNTTELEKTVNQQLANRKGADGAFWQVSELKVEGTTLTGKAKLSGGTSKPAELATMAAVGAFVADRTESKFVGGAVKLAEVK